MSFLRDLALLTSLALVAACTEEPGGVLGSPDGSSNGSEDAGGDGPAEEGGSTGDGGGGKDDGSGASDDGGTSGGSTGEDGSAGEDGGEDAGGGSGTTGTRDPSTITGIRKPTVKCGDNECEGTTQVCCDKWTTGGWTEPTCMAKDECSTFAFATATENNVKSECDGPQDCATGPADDPVVCCFVLQSPPHYDLALNRLPGPGYGRECLRKSGCLLDNIEAAEGRPQGILSCNRDSHCEAAGDDMSCEPEAMDDPSAGDLEPRPHVSLCK